MAEKMRELMEMIRQLVELQRKETSRAEQVTEQPKPSGQTAPSPSSGYRSFRQSSRPAPSYGRLRSPKSSRSFFRPQPPRPRPSYQFQRPGGMGTRRAPLIPPAPLPNLQAPKIATKKRLRKIGHKPPRAIRMRQPMSKWRSTERLLGAAGGFVPALGELAGLMQKLRHLGEAANEFGRSWGPKPPVATAQLRPPAQLTTALPASQPSLIGQAFRRGAAATGRAARNVAGTTYRLAKTAAGKARSALASLAPRPKAAPVPPVPTPPQAASPAAQPRVWPTVPPYFRSEMLYQTPQAATQSTARQAIEAGLPVSQVHKARQQAEDFYQRHTRNRHARLQQELLRGKEAGLSDAEAMKKGMGAVEEYLSRRQRPTQLGSRENPLSGGHENAFREMTELLRRAVTLLEQQTNEGKQRDTGQLPPAEPVKGKESAIGGRMAQAAFAGAHGTDPLGGAMKEAGKEVARSAVRSLITALVLG